MGPREGTGSDLVCLTPRDGGGSAVDGEFETVIDNGEKIRVLRAVPAKPGRSEVQQEVGSDRTREGLLRILGEIRSAAGGRGELDGVEATLLELHPELTRGALCQSLREQAAECFVRDPDGTEERQTALRRWALGLLAAERGKFPLVKQLGESGQKERPRSRTAA